MTKSKNNRSLFEFYVGYARDGFIPGEPPVVKSDANGVGAMEAFAAFESTGKILATREPDLLTRAFIGKKPINFDINNG